MPAAELVAYVAKSLADNPDGVSVEVEEDGDAVVLRLIVDEDDMGRVIGRNGSIAKAMRSLLKVISNRTGDTLTSALSWGKSFVLKRAIENLRSLSGTPPRLAHSHDSLRFQIAAPHKSLLGVISRSLSLQIPVSPDACIGTR